MNAVASSLFVTYCAIDVTDDYNFGTYLESFGQISLTDTGKRPAVGHDKLAKHWGVQPNCLKATVQQPIPRGVCMIANPICQGSSKIMIVCYDTDAYITQCSPIQCSLTHFG